MALPGELVPADGDGSLQKHRTSPTEGCRIHLTGAAGAGGARPGLDRIPPPPPPPQPPPPPPLLLKDAPIMTPNRPRPGAAVAARLMAVGARGGLHRSALICYGAAVLTTPRSHHKGALNCRPAGFTGRSVVRSPLNLQRCRGEMGGPYQRRARPHSLRLLVGGHL